MANIFLVRHGETRWNVGEVFRGRADVPLNERGIEQATAVGKALSGIGFKAIYASPLSRAMETAQKIADPQGMEVLTDEGLIDINYGEWEGTAKDEIEIKYPDLYRRWITAPHEVTFPGGESITDVRERAFEATLKLARMHEGETIALVSHRVPNKMILSAVMGMEPSRFWDIEQDTACINVFRYDKGDGKSRAGDRFIIAKVNDTSPTKPYSANIDTDF